MLFRQLFDNQSSTYTYIIADPDTQQAIIVDPVREQYSIYQQLISQLQLKLVMAIDTHTHADHVTSTGLLRQLTHCDIAMGEQTKSRCVTRQFRDGEHIKFGNIEMTTIYTPGHTNDSYSFVFTDRVLTGDLLLIRGTGRTDFQYGDPYQSYDSIVNKLFLLNDNMLVYPAHDYNGQTVSTIGEEKLFNPRLQVKSASEYATIMNNLNLPEPKLMAKAVPQNLNCGLPGQASRNNHD